MLLFALSVDALGPDEEYVRLLRRVRAGEFSGCLAGVIVVGETELDTKALGRELIFHLDRAGCAFPERPLVEATGSLRNLRITQKNLGLSSPEEALLAAAQALVERMRRRTRKTSPACRGGEPASRQVEGCPPTCSSLRSP